MSAIEPTSHDVGGVDLETLSGLLGTLDLRDRATARHSTSVARYARLIAGVVGMPQADRELVYVAGLVHDVGKLLLPDHILKGTAELDEDDWARVRRHPEQGAWLVAEVSRPGPLAEIVLDHHERLDGGGYPNGLRGEEISEHARIVSVADTYDVMTARDSYQEPITSGEAVIEMRRVAGTQLDSRYVEAMAKVARREHGKPTS